MRNYKRKGIIDGIETIQDITDIVEGWTDANVWKPVCHSNEVFILHIGQYESDGDYVSDCYLANFDKDSNKFTLLDNYSFYDYDKMEYISRKHKISTKGLRWKFLIA